MNFVKSTCQTPSLFDSIILVLQQNNKYMFLNNEFSVKKIKFR